MTQERWSTFTYAEQMGHIGSEVARARVWLRQQDLGTSRRCLERALELSDLTKTDLRWRSRLRELCRFREVLADQYADTKYFDVSIEELEQYCLHFAQAVKRG